MDNELNIENNDIIEEESISSKIKGAQDQINQMERMIEENHRMINLGDDVEGRTKMISHLENCILEEKEKIAKLKIELENNI